LELAPLVMRAVLGRDAVPDDEEMEGLRGAVAAEAVVDETCMEEGRGRFWTVRVEGDAEGLDVADDAATEGRGLEVEMVLLRFSPVVVVEVDVLGFAATSPAFAGSLARLAAVWRTLRVLLRVLGAGRALKAGLFSSFEEAAVASRFARSSRAAFNLAATASPGSWKVLLVGAFELLAAGGGVGKESETGRGLL
jgi:hypothetical protein